MGFNTTVVILNDALGDIENDPNFGKKLSATIRQCWPSTKSDPWVSAGSHCNAAYVVEQHHADHHVFVDVGGNVGKVVCATELARLKGEGGE